MSIVAPDGEKIVLARRRRCALGRLASRYLDEAGESAPERRRRAKGLLLLSAIATWGLPGRDCAASLHVRKFANREHLLGRVKAIADELRPLAAELELPLDQLMPQPEPPENAEFNEEFLRHSD